MAPPETAEELYQYLSRCKNELGIRTPLIMNRSNFNNFFAGGCISSAFGLPRTDAYQINGKVHYGSYDPQYKEVLTYLNRLYREGLLDPNFAVTDEPTAHSAIMGGTSALIFSAVTRIQVMSAAMNFAPDFTLVALPSMARVKGEIPMHSYADNPATNGQCVFVPSTSRQVENVLKFFNYAFTEKGHRVANFGIEGLTYNMVNGREVYTDFVNKNPNGHTLDGILRSHCLLNWAMIQDEWMTRQRFPMESQVDAMEKWGYSDGRRYRIINSSILIDLVDEYASLFTDINTFINESRAQFISGALPLDQFDSYYIAGLRRMGIERMLTILQQSYDVYNR